jgi:hypothetical protein
VDTLELVDVFGLAHVSGGASKRTRMMEEQVFGKMGSLTIGVGSAASSSRSRHERAARRARGHKRAGITFRDGFVHVALDLGGEGGGSPRRLAPGTAWNRIRALTLEASEPWSLELRRALPESFTGWESFARDGCHLMNPCSEIAPTMTSRMRNLASLSLSSGRGIGDAGFAALAASLALPKIRKLCLSGNNLGRKAAEAFAEALSRGGSGIDRDDDDVDDAMPGRFVFGARAASSIPPSANHPAPCDVEGCSLEDLDVSGNHIGSEGARALANALVQRGCANLRRLDLSQNIIGARGAAAVAEILRSQAEHFKRHESSNPFAPRRFRAHALEELSLRHNGCGDAGACAIAVALASSAGVAAEMRKTGRGAAPPPSLLDDQRYAPHALHALRLGFNGIGATGAKALAEAISATRTAASDCLGIDAARDARVVRELDLACNGVGPEGAKALAAALDDAVEELDLGNNGLGDEGAKWISKALGEGPNQTTTRLGLAGNDFGPDGAWWIADALSVNRTIARLDLGSNRVGDEGAADIAEELKTNNGVCEDRATTTKRGVRKRNVGVGGGVRFLDLRRNGIGRAGAEAMMDAVDAIGPGGVSGVCLRGNAVDPSCAAAIRNRHGLRIDVEMQQMGSASARRVLV